MVISFCKGWARFTGLKMPAKSILEAYGELIYNAAESVPDGKISISDLGHWAEVNDELLATLSRYEPPMEVEEKDGTFLHLERDPSHIVICSQKYLQKRAMLITNEYEQNTKYSKLSGGVSKKSAI
mmetsp:Transcript_37527/g.27675  ORF Transcript_37527/g.27675 Transcript_37527/m.27675 type:complete len:126 (+) Transcript_37527:627-1004(+)